MMVPRPLPSGYRPRKKEEMKSKLVRDKIPDIIRNAGEEPIVRAVHGAELCDALRDKLMEEAREVRTAPSLEYVVEELADLREVYLATLEAYGVTEDEIETERKIKAERRGVFTLGLVWEGNR
jgi:predicted house-cleaning noncanonical NTP pyrophosphatase (MazG superfamily)